MYRCQPSRVRQSEALLERNKMQCGDEEGSLRLVAQLLAKTLLQSSPPWKAVLAEWLRGTCDAEINRPFLFSFGSL